MIDEVGIQRGKRRHIGQRAALAEEAQVGVQVGQPISVQVDVGGGHRAGEVELGDAAKVPKHRRIDRLARIVGHDRAQSRVGRQEEAQGDGQSAFGIGGVLQRGGAAHLVAQGGQEGAHLGPAGSVSQAGGRNEARRRQDRQEAAQGRVQSRIGQKRPRQAGGQGARPEAVAPAQVRQGGQHRVVLRQRAEQRRAARHHRVQGAIVLKGQDGLDVGVQRVEERIRGGRVDAVDDAGALGGERARDRGRVRGWRVGRIAEAAIGDSRGVDGLRRVRLPPLQLGGEGHPLTGLAVDDLPESALRRHRPRAKVDVAGAEKTENKAERPWEQDGPGAGRTSHDAAPIVLPVSSIAGLYGPAESFACCRRQRAQWVEADGYFGQSGPVSVPQRSRTMVMKRDRPRFWSRRKPATLLRSTW